MPVRVRTSMVSAMSSDGMLPLAWTPGLHDGLHVGEADLALESALANTQVVELRQLLGG